ncbi:alpha/beta fold hydrolase [Pigmentiphaga soli]|uniref:Alpha/beta fold hydrolase n=1 Tax=Pigmentiphaga soli TaxID=1007095 RepID=A0ABP8HA94_9BURK
MDSGKKAAVAPRTIEVRTDDGVQLAVRVLREGAAAARPVLFIHALAMDGRMWERVAAVLDVPGTLYAIDCRGHGASGRPPAPFTTERFARDAANVLDAVGAPIAHLVGCSMGGTVALAFAGRFPGRLASLTAIDSTAWYGPEAAGAWEDRARRGLADGLASLVEFQVARWFSPGFAQANPDIVEQAVATFVRNDPECYAAACRMLGTADERGLLGAYAGPAAFVVGEDDYATPPAMSREAAGFIAGARVTVLPGCRHYTPLEAPEQVGRCIAGVVSGG